MASRGKLINVSEARRMAAEAFAAGLAPGDLLTVDEAEDIMEFRPFLAEALAHRHLQLQEEKEGWRVIRAPFTHEAVVQGRGQLFSVAVG